MDDEHLLEPDASTDSDSSHPNTLDITRIVIGNIDTFLDKYSYFILRTKTWIESYDPVMAYTVFRAGISLKESFNLDISLATLTMFTTVDSSDLNDFSIHAAVPSIRVTLTSDSSLS